MKIELLYSTGCLNVEQARRNLSEACAQAGIPAEWREYNLDAPDVPSDYKQYGSPTILVNGRDILPAPQTGGG
jgi:hypothetical protein